MKREPISPYFDIKTDADGHQYMEVYLEGIALLRLVLSNKGTAFTEDERVALGLDGLLPPQVNTLEQQVERVYRGFLREPDPIGKYQYLRALQERAETLLGAHEREFRRLSGEIRSTRVLLDVFLVLLLVACATGFWLLR